MTSYVMTYLLAHEDVLVEVQLHLFVRRVDAKLLETVAREILKSENIQNANDVFFTPGMLGCVYEYNYVRSYQFEMKPLTLVYT